MSATGIRVVEHLETLVQLKDEPRSLLPTRHSRSRSHRLASWKFTSSTDTSDERPAEACFVQTFASLLVPFKTEQPGSRSMAGASVVWK